MRARIEFVLIFSLMIVCALSAQQAKPLSTVPPGVSEPSAADAATISAVMAFEKRCDDAAVKGDVAFLTRALSPDFLMTHGDGWTSGGAPLKVDTKETWLAYVGKQPSPYIYRRLDSIQVELHGDIALTVGRYRYLPRPASAAPTTSHLYVWFERAYVKRNGEWQFLSHRTVKGPVREDDDPKSSSTR